MNGIVLDCCVIVFVDLIIVLNSLKDYKWIKD